jgi:hypothetical protein
MSFAAFVSGVMEPTVRRARAEDAMKRRLEEAGAEAKLTKALNEWEFYSPEERGVVSQDLDKILKQKKGYSADLLGKGEQGYKFLQGALGQQKPIQQLEKSASDVAALPVNLPQRIPGPESLDAVEPGQFEKGQDITIARPPVTLPRLPIEGANIPRVNPNVLQLPASQRAQAVKQYATDQAGIQTRSAKIAEINASDMDPEAKQIAIEALMGVPSGVLTMQQRTTIGHGGGGQAIGLGTIELMSPDGKQTIIAQPTRGGGYINSRTGAVIPPESIVGWIKRHFVPVQTFVNQQGNLDVLNKERLGSAMQQGGTLVGNVPDIRPAETKSPLVDAAGNIAGEWGSRSGPPGGGAPLRPVAIPGQEGEAPPPAVPPKPLRRAAVPLAEAKEMANLDKDEAFVKSIGPMFKDEFVGPAQGRWDAAMAQTPAPLREAIGYKGTPELAAFRVANAKILNSVIKFITGAQMGEKEAERIKLEVPNVNLHPTDWWAAYNQTLANIQMMKQRMMEMGRWPFPEREGQEAAPPPAAAGRGTPAPSGSAPRIGEHREFPNGKIGVWDGRGWKRVNPPSQ